jgi:peptidoglycan/xylan/chitin deacetylase (PgdA/CDA1 family)
MTKKTSLKTSFASAFIIILFLINIIVYTKGVSFTRQPHDDATIVQEPLKNGDLPSIASTSAFAKPLSSPRPLTFAQMNNLYGPCVKAPTIMYHHIQDLETAKAQGHPGLAVSPQYFQRQMEYLIKHGYTTITMRDLLNFFENNVKISGKPVLLTFDDGYEDFYTNAYPILSRYQLKATMFVPTGLMDNPGYLTWNMINSMAQSGNIYFANHTWSHKSIKTDANTAQKEVVTAQEQLQSHGLNPDNIFAYPYGETNSVAESVLKSVGMKLAFTTHNGNVLCKRQNLDLPRVRVASRDLNEYGF